MWERTKFISDVVTEPFEVTNHSFIISTVLIIFAETTYICFSINISYSGKISLSLINFSDQTLSLSALFIYNLKSSTCLIYLDLQGQQTFYRAETTFLVIDQSGDQGLDDGGDDPGDGEEEHEITVKQSLKLSNLILNGMLLITLPPTITQMMLNSKSEEYLQSNRKFNQTFLKLMQ